MAYMYHFEQGCIRMHVSFHNLHTLHRCGNIPHTFLSDLNSMLCSLLAAGMQLTQNHHMCDAIWSMIIRNVSFTLVPIISCSAGAKERPYFC